MGRSAGDSFALRSYGMEAMLPRHYPAGAFPVTYAIKDLGYAPELAAEAYFDAADAVLVKAQFHGAVGGGLGECYRPLITTLIDREQSTLTGEGNIQGSVVCTRLTTMRSERFHRGARRRAL